MEQHLQYYLPPIEMITKDHMKTVLTDEKRFLKMDVMKFCNVPSYDEVSVKNLYEEALKQPGMAKLFPDKYPKGRSCCRK